MTFILALKAQGPQWVESKRATRYRWRHVELARKPICKNHIWPRLCGLSRIRLGYRVDPAL